MIEDKYTRFTKKRSGILGLAGALAFIILGFAAPVISEYPSGYGGDILLSPSVKYLFGTDNLGLDVFSQVVWGTRTSIYVSFIAVSVAISIGIPAGLISGYKKGFIGNLIDGIIDIFLTLPMLPLMIVIASIVGSSSTNVAIVIGVFAWPQLARVVRNSTLKIAEMQYIEAAKCLGIPEDRILFRHVLANLVGPVLVNLTIIMSTAVVSESGLSFLGLGDPNTWSWGTILKKAWDSSAVIDMPNPWWWWLIPSVFIMLYVVSFNFLGTSINEALNPKED